MKKSNSAILRGSTQSTGVAEYDLLAAVVRLTIEDARQGDPDAREWLQVCAPDICQQLFDRDALPLAA